MCEKSQNNPSIVDFDQLIRVLSRECGSSQESSGLVARAIAIILPNSGRLDQYLQLAGIVGLLPSGQ
jgi:hypothetical protein